MIDRLLILIQIIFTAAFFSKSLFAGYIPDVLGTSSFGQEGPGNDEAFPNTSTSILLETKTAFAQKEVVENKEIAYETEKIDDQDLAYGEEEVKIAGVPGNKKMTYLVTHWLDEEIDRVLLSTEIEEPVTEVLSIGKKIVWKKLSTPDLGKIDYWAKMTVFATKYDSTCLGCNNTTALGAPVQEGVCAVDPKVIPMYTHFYVPGYGKCQALDVGGLIKGNRIDLAFRDAYSVSWGAEYVDIYLMDNAPTD